MSIELLDHPADIGFRARGANPQELFVTCARALVSIILEPAGIRPVEQFALSATGSDYESLLVNWLNEVLYYIDAKRMALGAFEVSRLDESHIEALARGEPRDPGRHAAKLAVKAVTYHQLKVARTEDGWVAEVYLDI
ncbi:MAG TPA: archease [Bryobacteraceae bacterium]|nr:archease [Bryobacteraceae bacterium]